MKRKFLPLLGIVLFFVSCSDESAENPPEIERGTLEVIAIFEGGETISEVSVSTIPETEVKVTDDSGRVVFNNIVVGSYQIVLTPSFSNSSLTVPVEVKKNQTETIEVVVGPTPISEVPLDIDFLLTNIYDTLKGEFLFDANGYSHYWGDIGMNISLLNQSSLGRYGDLDNYIFNPGNFVIQEVWSEHYKAIRLTNLGLDALNDDNFTSENNTNPLLAESELRFLRALLYFNLVKLYGNPILVTTAKIDFDNPTPVIQGRTQAYEQIVDDLKFAQQNLASGLPNRRASSEVATVLLGKVYLTMAGFPLAQSDKYALALQEFDKIIAGFTLEEEYANVFAIDNEGMNSEVIFSIDFDNSGNYGVPWGPMGISFNDRFLLTSEFVGDFFDGGAVPTEPVIFPISTDDTRFYQNIATFSFQNGETNNEPLIADWRPYKFVKDPIEPSILNEESFDYPYLRAADVYLMIAEAENAINGPTGKAYDALNMVRRRAFGDLDHDTQPGLSQSEFLNAILNERRLEFCFEGQLKDDFIRMQALETEILNFNQKYPERAKDFQAHKYIWPISQEEINLNPGAVQNEGY